jgi:bifunctional non-homologous end joining protein LigD
VLFPTGKDGDKNWMIHRMDPPPPGWEPVPELIRPMLCRTGSLPRTDDGWSYEFKWDGVRAIVYADWGHLRVTSRNDHDVTATYPELHALAEVLASRSAVLDGEIVALDDAGRPSFKVLQQRIHIADVRKARRLAQQIPATYLIFDLLYLEGRSTTALSYDQRRELLESLALEGPSWATPPKFEDVAGADIVRAAGERGLEGVVVKRRESQYLPGQRPESWIKVKSFLTQEVVIGGWTPGKGNRTGEIGALLLGVPTEGGLDYAGKVGTGFTHEMLADLARRLETLRSPVPPFVGDLPRAQVADATWVEPALVGEVRFTEWTNEGRLRHPSWRGLRPDKTPDEVVRES